MDGIIAALAGGRDYNVVAVVRAKGGDPAYAVTLHAHFAKDEAQANQDQADLIGKVAEWGGDHLRQMGKPVPEAFRAAG